MGTVVGAGGVVQQGRRASGAMGPVGSRLGLPQGGRVNEAPACGGANGGWGSTWCVGSSSRAAELVGALLLEEEG